MTMSAPPWRPIATPLTPFNISRMVPDFPQSSTHLTFLSENGGFIPVSARQAFMKQPPPVPVPTPIVSILLTPLFLLLTIHFHLGSACTTNSTSSNYKTKRSQN